MKNGRYTEEDGVIRYYMNGKLHRANAPAIEWVNGSKAWYINGELHREDGPAEEWSNDTKDWYYHGIKAKDEKEFYSEKWRKGVLLDLI